MITHERADFINEAGDRRHSGAQRAPAAGAGSRTAGQSARDARAFHGGSGSPVFCRDPGVAGRKSFTTAKQIKEEIYGSRLVLFAPLYISNRCANECTYCAFRATNATLKRRTLTQEEIAEETRILIRQGHKRILMVCRRSAAAAGLSIHSRLHRDDLQHQGWPRRDPARQCESGAANG